MINIDLIYDKWIGCIRENYSGAVPNIENENHLFELGAILRDIGTSPDEIDGIIQNISTYNRIIKINEERERKVPPGHILVKNKKSGYLYVILKSTYSDNPERYSLPTNVEKSEWESGVDEPTEKPEDQVITTPRVSKSKLKASRSDIDDIELKGDVEEEEPVNATEQPSDGRSVNKFKVNVKALSNKDRLSSENEFNSKRKKAKLELPETLNPYKIPDEVRKLALTPIIYPDLIERIINTYNIEQGADLNFYIDNFVVSGNLQQQLGKLITIINLTLPEELSNYFTNDLENYIKYVKEYDKTNKTTYHDDSALKKEWIDISQKTKTKVLNFLATKFEDEFTIVAGASEDANDIKALNLSKNNSKKPSDANLKINANGKDHWLRIKLAENEKEEDNSDGEAE